MIGSGSASFEMIRALVERLPVMITPRWVNTAAQPIGIEDVIEYLMAAIGVPLPESVIVEIGGSDVTSYLGIMREYARQRKLRRWFMRGAVSQPVLIQPLADADHAGVRIHRPLPDRERPQSERRAKSRRPLELFEVRPMGIARAIERALANEDRSPAPRPAGPTRGPMAPARCATLDPGRDVLTNEKTVRVPVAGRSGIRPISPHRRARPAGTSAMCCGEFAG